jgi:hypothetical protein
MVSKRTDFTFKHNQKKGRHGWLRLTPAYSITLVETILNENPSASHVLDPFAGTGTTGLVCGSRATACDLLDINPFLVWFARVKTATYDAQQLNDTLGISHAIIEKSRLIPASKALWTPPIRDIDRWWNPDHLHVLAKLFHALNETIADSSAVKDLLLVAFCRLLIQWSNAAFNHQSMSFKPGVQLSFPFDEEEVMYQAYLQDVREIVETARRPVPGKVRVYLNDSRNIPLPNQAQYDCVITSPPYPNRMSYIRELRPYMYWLGYLREAREAGEMDWQAIGGTWGIATSRLQGWMSDDVSLDQPQITRIVHAIGEESAILANYVHRYFVDMAQHFKSLYQTLKPAARLFYIIGNSKFYNTLIPVEDIYADLMTQQGFTEVSIKTLRKRNSKKELYEFVVSCRK